MQAIIDKTKVKPSPQQPTAASNAELVGQLHGFVNHPEVQHNLIRRSVVVVVGSDHGDRGGANASSVKPQLDPGVRVSGADVDDERAFFLDLLRRVRGATSWMLQKQDC